MDKARLDYLKDLNQRFGLNQQRAKDLIAALEEAWAQLEAKDQEIEVLIAERENLFDELAERQVD